MKDRLRPDSDLIDDSMIFRYIEDDTNRVPSITRMPDGMEVVEQRMGNAVGQWVLQVRCECGRRWFEVDAVDAATCPRCGVLVFVDIQPGGPAR